MYTKSQQFVSCQVGESSILRER